MATPDERAQQRGWIHAPIERVESSSGGYARLTIPDAWDVDIPLDVAAHLNVQPGTVVSFEVADIHKPGGDNVLYLVAIGEVMIWTPGAGEVQA